MARLQAGDDDAYRELLRIHGGRLLAVARRLMRNEEDARDCLQDGFLSAFRGIDRFEGRSKLGTWLHRIVVNTALMRLRSKRRKPEESIDDLLPSFQTDGHHLEQFSDWALPADRLYRSDQNGSANDREEPASVTVAQTRAARRGSRPADARLPESPACGHPPWVRPLYP